MSSELKPVPLSAPHMGGGELPLVTDCLQTGWISSVGSYVSRFENEVASYVGSGHAVATSSGTAALHLALLVAGVRKNDEVLVSNLTFIAAANAVSYVGAFPVFIDAEPDHWQLDIKLVRSFLEQECVPREGRLFNKKTGRRVAAILPVHVLGHPAELASLQSLSREFSLTLIEDASESLGSDYRGVKTGKWGQIGCFSFNGNKIISTGGGGMLVTDRQDWAAKARYLSTQAKDDPIEYIHHEIGYNYRLTNVQAAMGCGQMEVLEARVQRRRAIFHFYEQALNKIPGISLQKISAEVRSNCWLSTILVDPTKFGHTSRELRTLLARDQIESRPLWQPMHRSPAYAAAAENKFPVSDLLYQQALSLPSCSFLSDGDLQRVAAAIQNAART
jgi:perosamine synthetase